MVLCWWCCHNFLVLLFIKFLQSTKKFEKKLFPFSFHFQPHTFTVLQNFIFSLCLISHSQHVFGQQSWKESPSQSLAQTDPAMSLCLSPLSW